MRTRLLLSVSTATLIVYCGSVLAEPTPPPQVNWSGAYVGAHLGGTLTFTDIHSPFGPSIYGDSVRASGAVAGGQIGYNWQLDRWVLGIEAEASWADAFGSNTCFAFSGFYISANCKADIDATGTFSGRAGWLLGPDGETLLYGKAGLAWQHANMFASANGLPATPQQTSKNAYRWGFSLGAGVERAIGSNWSLRAEYGYRRFDHDGFTSPPGLLQTRPVVAPNEDVDVAPRAVHASSDAHLLKLGINYRLGETASGIAAPLWRPAAPSDAPPGVTLEIGTRYVYGWGRFQKDLGGTGTGTTSLASRLTYGGMNTNGVEALMQFDLANGLVAKGFIGWGKGSGRLNDEDWAIQKPIFVPYTNTLSNADDEIGYGIIDAGYNIWRSDSIRLTPFIGYSRFNQQMSGKGCVQVAHPNSVCSKPIASSVSVISEDDTWQALRLGAAGDIAIVPGVRLAVDAAYLPYVHFTGTDNHILRSLISPEWANGTGAQIDVMLTYALTEQFTIGVGGRYWAMWTGDGWTNFGGTQLVPMRYSVEQAALLLQGSYSFDWSGPLAPQ